MHEVWLLSVLQELQEYAVSSGSASLLTLVEAGYEAAKLELKISAPAPIGRFLERMDLAKTKAPFPLPSIESLTAFVRTS